MTNGCDFCLVKLRPDSDLSLGERTISKLVIAREWAMPSHETFSIAPITSLLRRYVKNSCNWIDPFARDAQVAGLTNDINPNTKAQFHLDAFEFVRSMPADLEGVLFDPPYSLHQLKEVYNDLGRAIMKKEAQGTLWTNLKSELSSKIKMGGLAICFGWNSIGFGKTRGFELIEVLLVSHGRMHNDTIVTVERKIVHYNEGIRWKKRLGMN